MTSPENPFIRTTAGNPERRKKTLRIIITSVAVVIAAAVIMFLIASGREHDRSMDLYKCHMQEQDYLLGKTEVEPHC